MNEPISPYVLTNKNSPAFWLIDNLWMPLAGSFSLTVISVLLSRFVALVSGAHRRTRILRNEGLYILEGQCTFNAGGQTVKAGPGTFVSIPRMVEHSFTVDVPNSRLLNFYTPAGVEMLLMSVAIAATERKPPVPNSLPMPPRWMVEECSREFGQIAVLGLPFVDPPTKDNMATKPSEVNPIKPYGVEVKNAPAYWSQGILWTNSRKLGSDWRFLLAYGAALLQEFRAPPHTHEQDEVLYIIEGQITLIAGAQKITAGAGSFAYVPAGYVHSFRVDAQETRLVNFYFPGGFESVITKFGFPAKSRTLPPPDLKTPGTPEQMRALSKRVGMVPHCSAGTFCAKRDSYHRLQASYLQKLNSAVNVSRQNGWH